VATGVAPALEMITDKNGIKASLFGENRKVEQLARPNCSADAL